MLFLGMICSIQPLPALRALMSLQFPHVISVHSDGKKMLCSGDVVFLRQFFVNTGFSNGNEDDYEEIICCTDAQPQSLKESEGELLDSSFSH